VPRQVQGDDPAPFRQYRLGEHPGVEVGAKAVQQQDRDAVALAHFEIAQAPSGGLKLARFRRFVAG
jgi:hypothetical protein